MFRRSRVAIIFLALAAVVIGWLWLAARHAAPSTDGAERAGGRAPPGTDAAHTLLAAVPDGALLVATVDVRALRRTPVGERLLGRGRRIGGLGRVTEVCGTDPMDGITELALVVPAVTSDGAFAVVATGQIDSEELLQCARTVIRQRGGEPVVSPMGGYRVLRDAGAVAPGPELAIRPGGPVILAQGATLRACVDAAEGRLPALDANRTHAELRESVGPGAVVATVVLTAELRRTLAQELALQGSPGSPASSVRAAAFSVKLAAALQAHLVLRCDQPAPCRELGQLLDRARTRWAASVETEHPALGALLHEAALRVRDSQVHVGMSVPLDRAADVLEALLAAPGWGNASEPSAATADAGAPEGAPPAGDGGREAGGERPAASAEPAPGRPLGSAEGGRIFDRRH